MKKVISLLETVVGSSSTSVGTKGDQKFSCPFCNHPEHKKKLYINLDPDRSQHGNWQCFVCDNRGKSLFSLLKRLDAEKVYFRKLGDILDKPGYKYAKSNEDDEDHQKRLELPDEFRPLWEDQPGIIYKHAIKHLRNRNLSVGDVVKHQIGYCTSGEYNKRIIVPSYDRNNKLNYFVARRIWDTQFPKYKNPSTNQNSIVPFDSLINWREPVTLVEGVFDAIAVRRNAIPLLGNKLSESLYCRLVEAQTNSVNIALDSDMKQKSLQMGERLMDEGFTVKLVDLPKNSDPGDIGFEEMQKRIRNSDPLSFSSALSRKLETV
jgi:transcription elongation factor Elf1